ncbi:hypothetical protein GWC95_15715 [Sediminibacterium roseum]|uniref:Calcineurin-like phosphoesterase domain-containing protein n=1 Tax=Sediminibacterium roseum TaxID=1978412 RepID=A0ABW9ZW54_9BACT|nr:metallophosphoesterase [Sediminibacterium roseum]NCI51376.1 hypothetical protein [Sediminibacterium roseum]
MSEAKRIKIAIVSDMHCHPESKNSAENQTWLFSDKLRRPTNEHPVENLLEIIDNKKIEVDYVLSPGDYADQANKQGLLSGWSYLKEMALAMKCPEILGTIGNHDIDSRHTYSNYSYEMPRKIRQNFPLHDNVLGKFWDEGYSFIDTDDVQFLIINSCHYHTHYEKSNPNATVENPAIKGKIDPAQLEEIEKILNSSCDHTKIKIAMSHHHPVTHARSNLGEKDTMEHGQELIELLGKFKFDLYLYGHKHDPWMRYVNTTSGHLLPTFSSGSFSATTQVLWANKNNYFHLIEIIKQGSQIATGEIETYTFQNQIGWQQGKDLGFLTNTGFGNHEAIEDISNRIINLFNGRSVIPWKEVIAGVPEISHLTPEKIEMLENDLGSRNVHVGNKIGINPKHLYYADSN